MLSLANCVVKLAAICLTLWSLNEMVAQAQSVPTATEIFQLRDKCQALAEKLGDEEIAGAYWRTDIKSNVSIKTLHCYVEIDRQTADLTVPTDKTKFRSYIYDGHTKELLASTAQDGQEISYGMIYDPYNDGPNSGIENVRNYIKKMMSPER
jgi:hypothetical protein